jgi:putative transposase
MPSARSNKRLRLPGYDYHCPGAYFITVVTRGRERLFGRIRDGQVYHSAEGAIAVSTWHSIPQHHRGVRLDAFVVMPDHLHGILVLDSSPLSLPDLVALFKAATTREINRLRGSPGAAIWHRSYHERIIRDDGEWNRIRRYIENNPRDWVD